MSIQAGQFVEERQKVSQASLTKYPQLFQNTYWAGHRLFPGEKEDIIENRNKFAEEYLVMQFSESTHIQGKLVDSITDMRLRRKVAMKYFHDRECSDLWDHVETYRLSRHEYVIITSPYKCSNDKIMDSQMKVLGWKKYAPLYNNSANTYVLHITWDKIDKFNDYGIY